MRLLNLHTAHMRHLIEIWSRYTTQDKVSDQPLKITFQRSEFVRKAPLPCESINFIIFSFILHHKYQNNLSE